MASIRNGKESEGIWSDGEVSSALIYGMFVTFSLVSVRINFYCFQIRFSDSPLSLGFKTKVIT